jgi:hypothetical protein
MLLAPPQYSLLTALCHIGLEKRDKDAVVPALVSIFSFADQVSTLMRLAIQVEVSAFSMSLA